MVPLASPPVLVFRAGTHPQPPPTSRLFITACALEALVAWDKPAVAPGAPLFASEIFRRCPFKTRFRNWLHVISCLSRLKECLQQIVERLFYGCS